MNGDALADAASPSAASGTEDDELWYACLICHACFEVEDQWTEHRAAQHASDHNARVLVLSLRDLSPEIRIRSVDTPPPITPKTSNDPVGSGSSQWRKVVKDDSGESEPRPVSVDAESDVDDEDESIARRHPSAWKLRPRSSKSYRFSSSSSASATSTESASEEEPNQVSQVKATTADGDDEGEPPSTMEIVNGHEKENYRQGGGDEEFEVEQMKDWEKMDVDEGGSGQGVRNGNGARLVETAPKQARTHAHILQGHQQQRTEELAREAAAAYGQSLEVCLWKEESMQAMAATAAVKAQACMNTSAQDHGFGFGYFGGEVICPVCWRRFKSRSQLKSHIALAHHGIPAPILCPTCGVRFATPKSMRIHARRAHRPKKESFLCKICDCVFICERNLFRHKQRHHQSQRKPKPTSVEHVPAPVRAIDYEALDRLEQLEEERRLEDLRLRPVPCKHCDRRFRLERHLHLHMLKMHPSLMEPREPPAPPAPPKEEATPVPATAVQAQGAPARAPIPAGAAAVYNLKATASGNRPFRCEVCSKTFKMAAHLRVHLVSHETNEEKRFQCSLCLRKFGLPHHLKQHLRTHRCGGYRRGHGLSLNKKRKRTQNTAVPLPLHVESVNVNELLVEEKMQTDAPANGQGGCE